MEEPLVFDATPLIYLARVDRLAETTTLATECLIPEAVYREVVTTGLDAGYPDARRIEAAAEADRLTVSETPADELTDRLERNEGLSAADVSVLVLAATTDGTAVIDESKGRQVARVEDITVHGTAYLVLALLREDVLTREETLAAVDGMIEAGWYCSTALYTRIRERIDELANG